MPDIEQRLKALEKRARADHERWQMLDEQMKALALVREAIVRPICAALIAAERRARLKPQILQAIIDNLKDGERNARLLNAHAKMILEFRAARKLFEAIASKVEGGPPKSGDESRHGT